MRYSYENILVARICHDLITPCNAVNLGLEAYEMSHDESMFSCVKEGIGKANTILTFIRELFSNKNQDFIYSKLSIERVISDFLKIYNIEVLLQCVEENISYPLGSIILYVVAVMKEVMPFGGKTDISFTNNSLKINYVGTEIRVLDVEFPEELTYKNILRFKLLEKLRDLNFSVESFVSEDQGLVLIKH